MVATAIAANGAAGAQSGAQSAAILSIKAGAAIVGTDSQGDVFGAAVVIDISVAASAGTGTGTATTAAGKLLSEGQSAITTLQATQKQSKDMDKATAGEQLMLALKEIELLKLLSPGLPAAREAVRLAKQINAAVQNFVQAGGDVADSDAFGATLQADGIDSDSFFDAAQEGLADLKKFLDQQLPPLLASNDPKKRKEATTLGQEFADADAEANQTIATVEAEDAVPAASTAAAS